MVTLRPESWMCLDHVRWGCQALATIVILGCSQRRASGGGRRLGPTEQLQTVSSASSTGTPYRRGSRRSPDAPRTTTAAVLASSSADSWESMPLYLFSITMSTPQGWPPMCSSIQLSRSPAARREPNCSEHQTTMVDGDHHIAAVSEGKIGKLIPSCRNGSVHACSWPLADATN